MDEERTNRLVTALRAKVKDLERELKDYSESYGPGLDLLAIREMQKVDMKQAREAEARSVQLAKTGGAIRPYAHHRGLCDRAPCTCGLDAAEDAFERALTQVAEAKPFMPEWQARDILREYPDADLSAFKVEGDVEEMAIEEAATTTRILDEK